MATERSPVESGEYWGHGSVFGVQSLGEGSSYWYAASKADD